MKRYTLIVAFLAALAILVLVACAQKTPEPVTFTIEMSEFAFTPNTLEVKVGQEVTLNLVNRGALQHEIMFGHDVAMMGGRPSGYQSDLFMTAGVEPMVMGGMEGAMAEEEMGHEGFAVILAETGDQATMTFTVTDDMVGEWEIGCFEQEGVHYDAGMKGTLVVLP